MLLFNQFVILVVFNSGFLYHSLTCEADLEKGVQCKRVLNARPQGAKAISLYVIIHFLLIRFGAKYFIFELTITCC
jgi:hypothetical protein